MITNVLYLDTCDLNNMSNVGFHTLHFMSPCQSAHYQIREFAECETYKHLIYWEVDDAVIDARYVALFGNQSIISKNAFLRRQRRV
jgi:hypothetical protein